MWRAGGIWFAVMEAEEIVYICLGIFKLHCGGWGGVGVFKDRSKQKYNLADFTVAEPKGPDPSAKPTADICFFHSHGIEYNQLWSDACVLQFSLVKGCTTFSMVNLEASRKMEEVAEICCEKNLVVNDSMRLKYAVWIKMFECGVLLYVSHVCIPCPSCTGPAGLRFNPR